MKGGGAQKHIEAALQWEAKAELPRAEREYRRALELAPSHPIALNNLGYLYASRGDFAKAAPLFRRAAFLNPRDAGSLINLAGVLRELGDEAGALDGFGKVLALDPTSDLARLNLANLLRSQGQLDAARPHYQALLQRDPRNGFARWNLAALEGLAGNLEAAFSGFMLHHALQPAEPPPALPRWDGGPLGGKRLLLEANQGLGDTLMFARFVRPVSELGATVILRGQPELEPVLSNLAGLHAYARRDRPGPQADVWFPLVDLPALPALSPRNGFWPAPYVGAPSPPGPGPQVGRPFRVGLVWAGNPGHPDDRNRSMALPVMIEGLAGIDGVELVSLQKGPRAADADGTVLIRADRDIADFADTAAAIMRLDLVVAVDTSVLHLAAAMGRPTWALLAHAPDWRWMLQREDSPWYPSLRLFRQPRPRDWPAVIARVAQALRPSRPPSAAPQDEEQ
jgi:Flp pilus assembly protein TadD